MHRRWKLAPLLLVISTTFLATGCGSSSAQLRLINAFPSQPSLDMLVDSKTVASGVGYGAASAYVTVSSGSRHLQVESPPNVLADQTITVTSGTDSSVISTSSGTVVVTDHRSAPSSGNISIRAINASSSLGTADVYIVASGTDISTVSPIASNLTFPAASAYQTLAAGSYQVIFTLPGQKGAVISSSPTSFSSGQVRSVVGLDGQSGGFTTSVLSDLN